MASPACLTLKLQGDAKDTFTRRGAGSDASGSFAGVREKDGTCVDPGSNHVKSAAYNLTRLISVQSLSLGRNKRAAGH